MCMYAVKLANVKLYLVWISPAIVATKYEILISGQYEIHFSTVKTKGMCNLVWQIINWFGSFILYHRFIQLPTIFREWNVWNSLLNVNPSRLMETFPCKNEWTCMMERLHNLFVVWQNFKLTFCWKMADLLISQTSSRCIIAYKVGWRVKFNN